MKRLFAISVVMLLSTAMFFVVVCAGAGPVAKPFQAMWTGTIYVLGPCPDTTNFPIGAAQAINVGKGVSTLAGNSNFISSYCTSCTSPTETPPYYCNEMAGSGWIIMTAANGDALHLEITEVTVDLTKVPPEWTEHETVVGGTGRFVGMEGNKSVSGGTWTFKTDPFPYGESIPPKPPVLYQLPPQGWIGTTQGTEGWSTN